MENGDTKQIQDLQIVPVPPHLPVFSHALTFNFLQIDFFRVTDTTLDRQTMARVLSTVALRKEKGEAS